MNDKQVKLLRKKRFEDGLSQEAAAAWLGVCPKTARKWEKGLLPSEIKKPRDWRTRKDPLEGMWDEIIVPLLQRDEKEILEATTLLDLLKKKRPDTVSEKNLRTLQRRMRDWKALHGLPKEVFFTQEHPPGREGQIDFTHCDTLGVTIGGAAFPHLIFEFVLSCSGYRWAQLASSETFEALSSGIQGAVWSFGGSPRCWRTDNLSAATHQLKSEGCWVLTERYQGLVDHYEVQSTRIAPGESNENGVVEKAHDTLKKHIAQALFLRGSSDFASIEAYWAFVAGIVEKLNASKREAFEEERKSLLPLPSSAVPFYSEYQRKVSRNSCIQLAKQTYSVPSRLIGYEVTVRVYPAELEIRYGSHTLERFPRLRGDGARRVDYRHIIDSLVRKPGAFARYKFREELFPSLTFRKAYDAMAGWRGGRADVDYVRILQLAATTMETDVEAALEVLLEAGVRFDYGDVKDLAAPREPAIHSEVAELRPQLREYDRLLSLQCQERLASQTANLEEDYPNAA